MGDETSDDDTEAVLSASRGFLGLIAASLAPTLGETRLDDYRILVLLNSRGALDRRELAAYSGATALAVEESLRRLSAAARVNARDARVTISSRGRALVDEVTERRRRAIAHMLGTLESDERRIVVEAMKSIARATEEPKAEALLILAL